jgi:mycofactocin system glycosyltransferase
VNPAPSLALDSSVRCLNGGGVLLGGSPLRLLTLSDTAQRILATNGWSSRSGVALADRLLDAGLAHPTPEVGTGPGIEQVSVVIPVRDRAVQLAALVSGLDPELEVIIVDDGSDPPLPGATLRHNTARGPAAARNAGIARATRPFVALLDSDVVPPAGWLDRLLPHFSDPRVAAVAPRIVAARGSVTGPISSVLVRYDAARSPLDLGPRPAAVRPGSRVSYVPAAALVLRRSALGEPAGRPTDCPTDGPFDERLRYGEDVDLVWRLVAAGWRLRYEPAAAVGHAHRQTLRAAAAQRFGYGYSAAPLAARHPGLLAPFAGNRWVLATWGLLAAGKPALSAATLVAAGVRLSRKLPVDRPLPLAARLTATTALRAGRALGEALTRPYGPVALPLLTLPGPLSAFRRRVAVAALTLPALAEYRKRHPEIDPARWLALRIVDDLAYGAGLWAGCVRERSFAALRPRVS